MDHSFEPFAALTMEQMLDEESDEQNVRDCRLRRHPGCVGTVNVVQRVLPWLA